MEATSYTFSNIRFPNLQKIVSLRQSLNPSKFDEWFNYPYDISDVEISFLDTLIQRHFVFLPSYMEEDLKMKFLSPIFNQVNFMGENLQDWYNAPLSGFVNGVEIGGYVDFMVATGTEQAEKPYFFIQEFKPSIPDKDPRVQVLAEILVAIEKNQTNIMRGGYIIGRNWVFVIVEKTGENQFQYFSSESLDSLKLSELKQIYVCLQAVKLKYCQD